MAEIEIVVKDKKAIAPADAVIVCGNSDYLITFVFDEEWIEHDDKTARFLFTRDGTLRYIDVAFTGERVHAPALLNVQKVLVGVYAGDLFTTTSAVLNCCPSILCPNATENAFDAGDFLVDREWIDQYVKLAVDSAAAAAESSKQAAASAAAHEVYVGSGDMPEGYKMQIDPNAEMPDMTAIKEWTLLIDITLTEAVKIFAEIFEENIYKEVLLKAKFLCTVGGTKSIFVQTAYPDGETGHRLGLIQPNVPADNTFYLTARYFVDASEKVQLDMIGSPSYYTGFSRYASATSWVDTTDGCIAGVHLQVDDTLMTAGSTIKVWGR